MAIGFNLPMSYQALTQTPPTPEQMGVPDYVGSMYKGMKAGYEPARQSEELLGAMLQNRINQAKAKYAEKNELANLQHTLAGTANIGADTALMPYRKKLLEAQFMQAGASADKARAMADLITKASTGGFTDNNQSIPSENETYQAGQGLPPYAQELSSAMQPQQQVQNPQQAQKSLRSGNNPSADMAAALLHIPVSSQLVNGNLITNNPLSGMSSTKVGPNAQELELSKEDAKKISGMENEAIKGYETNDILKGLDETLSNPIAQTLKTHPNFANLQMKYLAANGTDEQKKLVADLEVYSNKLIAQTAKGLNTRFTDKDLAFAQRMKIDPGDSYGVSLEKLQALKKLQEKGQRRLEGTIDLARKGNMSVFEATRTINKQIEDSENNATKNKKVQMISPLGHKVTMTEEQARGALNRKKGWKRG